MKLANTETRVVEFRDGVLGSFYPICWKCNSINSGSLSTLVVMMCLLFLSYLISMLWICLRCLLTLDFEKMFIFLSNFTSIKKFFRTPWKLKSGGRPCCCHIIHRLINSSKCDVCHVKKQGAIWYSWSVILFQMSPPVLAWQNAVLFNPRPPTYLNWRLITHFWYVVRECKGLCHLCTKVRACNLAAVLYSRTKPDWPLMPCDT